MIPSLNSILEIPKLSSGARQTLAGLLSFRNRTTGLCCPRIDTLCARLGGASRRSVIRWIKELKDSGAVLITYRRGPSQYDIQVTNAGSAETETVNNSTCANSGSRTCAKFGTPGAPYPLYEPDSVEPTARYRAGLPPKRKSMQRARASASVVLERYYELFDPERKTARR